jgi:predicted nucleotidyltransferase component of viral defense system
MIEKAEIESKAAELDVHVSNVQRDYVFGWLLAGVFASGNPLASQVFLKGGNAFRKGYFERARFSNDLDFSAPGQIDEESLKGGLHAACKFAQERSGVQFFPDDSRVSARTTANAGDMYEARVYFQSFYGSEEIRLKVELDIQEYDRILLPTQIRRLIHAYSDAEACRADIRCLKLEELLAAKLKALLQRQHSPDLYDFVYSVFFQKTLEIRRLELITTFLRKTIYEPTPAVARGLLLELPFQVLRGFWREYLVTPRASIIDFEEAESAFRSAVGELFALVLTQPSFATAGVPGTSYAASPNYYRSSARATIFEAGRLRRILRLLYDGSSRQVEPYALVYKRRQDGIAREYFYAWDLTGSNRNPPGIRSFFPEKVQAVELTDQTFEPRFPIELIKTDTIGGYFATPFSSRRNIATRSASPKRYTFRCAYCGRTFKRDTYNTRLREHNDERGNACYGRYGTIV